jgi:3-oxoacyl-[acyl-carrier protein] reductase
MYAPERNIHCRRGDPQVMRLEFFGRRALILGGTCDLAITLAELLIQEGLHPILTWRSEAGRGRLSALLESLSGRYETVHLDLASRPLLQPLLSELKDDLDYLVDFAHGDMECLIGSANPDEIHRYFSENVSTRAELLRLVARIMLKKKRGRMVFVSSSAALKPNPGQGFYAAAKLASEAIYRNLGLELAGRGVTTVTLRPGYIHAGRGSRYLEAREVEALRAVPLGRALTCKEVAQAALFFLSDGAWAFNATEISMDGGLTAGK